MICLRIPNRSVVPADFQGRPGICQNLDCLALLEPPYRSVRLRLPGGKLETVLCCNCLPRRSSGPHAELWLEVVAVPPVLTPPVRPDASVDAVPGLVNLADLARQSPPPPPVGSPGKIDGPLTFAELAKREPRLLDLLAEAQAHHRNREPVFCANAVMLGYPGFQPGLKNRLRRLVGWEAGQGGMLRTREAYDLAFQTIYQALPDCRRCGCG
jgi:hypothetical protein